MAEVLNLGSHSMVVGYQEPLRLDPLDFPANSCACCARKWVQLRQTIALALWQGLDRRLRLAFETKKKRLALGKGSLFFWELGGEKASHAKPIAAILGDAISPHGSFDLHWQHFDVEEREKPCDWILSKHDGEPTSIRDTWNYQTLELLRLHANQGRLRCVNVNWLPLQKPLRTPK